MENILQRHNNVQHLAQSELSRTYKGNKPRQYDEGQTLQTWQGSNLGNRNYSFKTKHNANIM